MNAPLRNVALMEALLQDIEAQLRNGVTSRYANLQEQNVAWLLENPARIPKRVYGISVPNEWPCGKSTVEVLADCRENLRNARSNLTDPAVPVRIAALEDAESALVKMLGGM